MMDKQVMMQTGLLCPVCNRRRQKGWHSRDPKHKGELLCFHCYKKEYSTPMYSDEELHQFFNHSFKRRVPMTKDEERYLQVSLEQRGYDELVAKERIGKVKAMVTHAHKCYRASYGMMQQMPNKFKIEFRRLTQKNNKETPQ